MNTEELKRMLNNKDNCVISNVRYQYSYVELEEDFKELFDNNSDKILNAKKRKDV